LANWIAAAIARCSRSASSYPQPVTDTPTPHDALFKSIFGRPDLAARFLRTGLPKALVDRVAWDQLARVSEEFIVPSLAGFRTDVLFDAPDKRRALYMYMSLEHRSTGQRLLPARKLNYVNVITQRHLIDHPGEVPVVVPIVVSHAVEGYRSPRSYHELFSEDLEALGLAAVVPNFTVIVEDLALMSNAELKARGLGALLILAICALRDSRAQQRLMRDSTFWAGQLIEALRTPTGMDVIVRVLRYLRLTRPPEQFQDLNQNLLQHLPSDERAILMEITLEDMFAAQMRAEGRVEGQAEMLARQIELKFGELPDPYRRRLGAADASELLRYGTALMSAQTIEAVFAPERR
jgi:predicted transposase/invertase (TIGR01784 family)